MARAFWRASPTGSDLSGCSSLTHTSRSMLPSGRWIPPHQTATSTVGCRDDGPRPVEVAVGVVGSELVPVLDDGRACRGRQIGERVGCRGHGVSFYIAGSTAREATLSPVGHILGTRADQVIKNYACPASIVVRDTGIEPVTSSVSGKRSPAELIARGKSIGGGDGNRTRVHGFAGRCLTTRPLHRWV